MAGEDQEINLRMNPVYQRIAFGTQVKNCFASVISLKSEFNKLRADFISLRTAYEAHRVDVASHTLSDTTNEALAVTSAEVTATLPEAIT